MGSPVANVQQTITIQGVDSASDAIKRAQASLKGLESQAVGTGQAASDAGDSFADGAKGLAGKAAKGLKGISKFAGDGSSELAGMGKEAKGLSLVMGALPAPIGLAVVATVALVAGAKSLYDHFSQAAAASRLLATPETRALGEALDLDAASALKVAIALDGLAEQTRPNNDLIKEVIANAKALGEEPVAAVEALAKAWANGVAGVLAYEQAHGRLAGLDKDSLIQMANRLGLDKEALGLVAKRGDLTAQLNQQTLNAAQLAGEAAKDEAAQQKLYAKGRSESAQYIRDEANLEANHMIDKIAFEKTLAASADKTVQATQQALSVQQAVGELEKGRAHLASAREAEAELARTKALGTGIKMQSIMEQQASIALQIDALEGIRVALGGKETDIQINALNLLKLQLDAKQKGMVDADHAEQKAKASAAAQKAESAKQAIVDAQLRTEKAKADRDGIESAEERLALIDREHAKALQESNKGGSPKAKNALKLAADEEYATKKAKLTRDLAAEEKKAAEDVNRALGEQAKKGLDVAQKAADAQTQLQQAKAKSLADVLRGQGRDDEAALVEERQAQADHAAELVKIDKEREVSLLEVTQVERQKAQTIADALTKEGKAEQALQVLKAQSASEAENVAKVKVEAQAKVGLANQKLEDQERAFAESKKARDVASREAAAQGLENVAQALKDIRANGNFAAAAVGNSVSSITKGLTTLGRIADDDKQKLGKMVEAIGGAAAGVATAIIQASNARLLSQLDIEEQGALKGAKTEKEKAEITEKYEKKKADARDAATRQSAGIQALFAAAQAIAYAFTPGMQWAAVGQGIAAAAFGAIAGGATGSSYVPGAATAGMDTSGSAGGFNSAGSTGGSGSGGGSGTVTIIQNYNQPLVTQQQIGKSVNGALQSLRGTGTDRSRGA